MDMQYKYAGNPLRALIMNMMEGYAYCKMQYADGNPHDFAYLEVNPAFLQLTGLKDVIGKNVSDVIPGIKETNPELFEIFGRVASTGNSERFENYISALGIWLTISVYCPELGYFVSTFDNVTKRKEKEIALANSEERFRLMFENILQGIVFHNELGEITFANKLAENILGLTLDQMQGHSSVDPMWRCIHENGSDFPGDTHPAIVALKTGKPVENVIMGIFNPKINETRWISVSAVPLIKAGTPTPNQVFASFLDITEKREKELALKESERNLKLFIEHAPAMLAMFNADMQYIAVSGIWKKVYSLGDRNIIGVSHYELFPDIPERWKNIHQRCLTGEVMHAEEDLFERADGTVQWLRWEVRPWHKGDGSIGGIIFFSEDISERKMAEQEISKLAFYDSLTKLPNRRLLDDRIELAIVASKRSALFGAVLFLDLDNFKPLNDTHGHKAGDLLLIEVARRLLNCVREVDTVARFGGDEFVIVLSELDEDKTKSIAQANIVAEKIKTVLAETYWLSSDLQGTRKMVVHKNLGVSIGVVIFNKDCNAENILKLADNAMYQAKETGRNQIRLYEQ